MISAKEAKKISNEKISEQSETIMETIERNIKHDADRGYFFTMYFGTYNTDVVDRLEIAGYFVEVTDNAMIIQW